VVIARLAVLIAALAFMSTFAVLRISSPGVAHANLEGQVGHYIHDPNLDGGGTNCFDTDNKEGPINVVLYDWPQPTSNHAYGHVNYHTYAEAPFDEWSPSNETGAALMTWSDGSGGCRGAFSHSQPATSRPAGGIRYHLRLFEIPGISWGTWNLVDPGNAHHEKACGTFTTGDKILAGYSGWNQARDILTADMNNYGSLHDEHQIGGYFDWGNTKAFDAVQGTENSNCTGGYVAASDGYVTYVHIPNEGHPGFPD
jgi:hypothetical protein